MHELHRYERAKLVITVFDSDGIHTDTLAASGYNPDVVADDMLPVIGVGAPVSGLGSLRGQRNSFDD